MNTFLFYLPGSRQPSWIFLVPTSCPRMAHCHPTDLSSGTHNLYDSAKTRTRPSISRFPILHNRVTTRLRDWRRSATEEAKATTIRRKIRGMISGLAHAVLIDKTVKVHVVCHIFCMTCLGFSVYTFLMHLKCSMV